MTSFWPPEDQQTGTEEQNRNECDQFTDPQV